MTHNTDLIEKAWPALEGQVARARMIPISFLEGVRSIYRDAGIPIRVKFRGPRAQSVGRLMPTLSSTYYKRTKFQAASYCLREDATYFSVYNK